MKNGAYIDRFLQGVEEIARKVSREDIDRAIETLYRVCLGLGVKLLV